MPDKIKETIVSEQYLSSYASRSDKSRGRRHKETEHPYRSMFQRDRERIIHTTAFRRLEYKTQVFVNHEGDYYRTRLTHTIEVAQIARTIARTLLLNEDLAESIALAHDLGHTPFGHSGEEVLNEIMKGHGGFDHNMQGLRVVDILEDRYPDFIGLNLTYEVREGIIRHSSSYDNPPKVDEFNRDKFPTLEAQIVDVADEIAYYSHDLDDGLASGILSEDALSQLQIWKDVLEDIKSKKNLENHDQRRYQAIRHIINRLVTDLIEHSKESLRKSAIVSGDDARKFSHRLIDFSETIISQKALLRDFLYENFYNHYRVTRMATKAKRFIKDLFELYLNEPKMLPDPYNEKAKDPENRRTVICDYIAGMTDRYALDEYMKLFQPYERV